MRALRWGLRPAVLATIAGLFAIVAFVAFRPDDDDLLEPGSAPPPEQSLDGDGASGGGGSTIPADAGGTQLASPAERSEPKKGLLRGVVVGLDDGAPIPEARVSVEGTGGAQVADADGRFTIDPIRFPATLSAEAPGRTGLTVRLDGPPARELVIPLPPPLGLRAAVVDARGFEPIRGAFVRIESATRFTLRSGTTDDHGKVELAIERVAIEDPEGIGPRGALERAATVVWAEASGHNRVAVAYNLLSLRLNREEQIELRRTKGIPGRVVDERGAGIPNAHIYWGSTVEIQHYRQRRCEDTQADEAGRFTLRPPADASECFVAAFHKAFAPAHTILAREAIEAGDEVLILVREPCVLRGEVRGARGEPIAGAAVRLVPAAGFETERHARWLEQFSLEEVGEPIHVTRSGLDGTFRLARLAPGNYEVHIEHGAFIPSPGNDRTIVLPRDGIWVARLLPGGRISGMVLDADGNPPPRPNMILRPADRTRRGNVTPRVQYDESDGAFFAEGLEATEYLFDITSPGHERMRQTVRPGDENLFVVLVRRLKEDSRSVEVRFSHRGRSVAIPSLHAALHDPETGDLVTRRICEVSSGIAVLEGVPRRTLDLVITPRLYRPVIIRGVRFDLPDPPEVSVALETGREVRGRVVYEGPPARRPGTIALLDAEGVHELFTATVAEDGSFTLFNLMDGRYVPRVPSPPGRYEPAEPIDIGASDAEIVIEIRGGADQGAQGT